MDWKQIPPNRTSSGPSRLRKHEDIAVAGLVSSKSDVLPKKPAITRQGIELDDKGQVVGSRLAGDA